MNNEDIKISDEQLKEKMQFKLGIQPFGRLRWVFFFKDRPKKIGGWNASSNIFNETAASINKTGLVCARIEIEITGHWVPQVAYECDGHDYVSASWLVGAKAGVPLGRESWKKDSYKLVNDIMGLSFTTRKERVYVMVDGKIRRRPNTPGDLKFKLTEHNV